MTDVITHPSSNESFPESKNTEVAQVINEGEGNNAFAFQVDANEYIRVDESLLGKFSEHIPYNAIHGTLSQHHSYISRYEIHVPKHPVPPVTSSDVVDNVDIPVFVANVPSILCVAHIGDRLCGHPGIVHGGIISALFDNTFGWLLILNSNSNKKARTTTPNASSGSKVEQSPIKVFTANLSVNFRLPVFANTTAVIKASVTEIQGRKIYVHATWEIDGKIHADATALFIIPKSKV